MGGAQELTLDVVGVGNRGAILGILHPDDVSVHIVSVLKVVSKVNIVHPVDLLRHPGPVRPVDELFPQSAAFLAAVSVPIEQRF